MTTRKLQHEGNKHEHDVKVTFRVGCPEIADDKPKSISINCSDSMPSLVFSWEIKFIIYMIVKL